MSAQLGSSNRNRCQGLCRALNYWSRNARRENVFWSYEKCNRTQFIPDKCEICRAMREISFFYQDPKLLPTNGQPKGVPSPFFALRDPAFIIQLFLLPRLERGSTNKWRMSISLAPCNCTSSRNPYVCIRLVDLPGKGPCHNPPFYSPTCSHHQGIYCSSIIRATMNWELVGHLTSSDPRLRIGENLCCTPYSKR